MDDRQISHNRSLQLNVKLNEGGRIFDSKAKGDCNSTANLKDSLQTEFYKPITEESLRIGTDTKMVQESNDGADEQMLGMDNQKLSEKREEVKFIKGDHQNGDAKIDIGAINGKAFTGMTKEELMKYANDPFWVRLRWIFFIAFWAIWVGMLVGAILIIMDAPKCAAPEPLRWYKRGPLAKFEPLEADLTHLAAAQKLQATGVVYELPAEFTYSVRDPKLTTKIEEIVAIYKDTGINVILDITANYATNASQILKDAQNDEKKRSAFIWIQSATKPNDWVSIVNGSAWSEVQKGNFVLSQFGDGRFDLNMNDSIVRKELSESLKYLIGLGVRGFRLKNTKFFLLSDKIEDEAVSDDPKYDHTQYLFWTHKQTTFQAGLGDVLQKYLIDVKNVSADAFLSVADDIIRPDIYQTSSGEYGVDIPLYKRFTHFSNLSDGKKLQKELQNTMSTIGNSTWLQWDWTDVAANEHVNPSAFGLFMSLLPGVPVIPVDSSLFRNISEKTYKHIEQLRSSPSYMHGNFDMYDSGELLSYSRIKSGNPGYFVAYNPTNQTQYGNYSNLHLPEKMNVDAISENFDVMDVLEKSKIMTDSLEVSPFATIILTYVPLK